MMYERDKEWVEKLQTAVLAANTQTKHSTGYTPFYLMFGRDFDSSKLLNLITFPPDSDIQSQPTIESDADLSQPNLTPIDIAEFELSNPYEPPNSDDEWVNTIADTREKAKKIAIDNIKKEQKIQKITYDRKVKRNRYVN